MKKNKTLKTIYMVFQVSLMVLALGGSLQSFTKPAQAGNCYGPDWDCNYTTTTLTASPVPINWQYSTPQAPMTMTEYQTYSFTYTIDFKSLRPGYNWNGGDIVGMSIYQILNSGGTDLTTVSAVEDTNNAITIKTLSDNRSNGVDDQQAVNNQMQRITPDPSKPLYWDKFQCPGTEMWNANLSSKSITAHCTFTPQNIGYIQVDVNSFDFYKNSSTQNCQQGLCGPIGAFFGKIVPPTPTPTPTPTTTPTSTPTPTPTNTPTPTPVPSQLLCDNISFKNADTGAVYSNGSQIPTSLDANGNPINLNINSTINGTAQGISQVHVQWELTKWDILAGTIANTIDKNIHTVNVTNGNYSDNFSFQFGQIENNGKVIGNDSFMYFVIPTLSFTQDGVNKTVTTPPECSGELITTSGSVQGATSSIQVNKSLVEAGQAITVGQTIHFTISIKNTGSTPLTSVNFSDVFTPNGVISFQSASATETNSGVTSASVDLTNLTATNGTTNSIDLVAVPGFRQLNTNDYFTVTLAFLASAPNSNTDCVSVTTSGPSGTSCASVTVTPPPSSPNTGAETPITVAALLTLLASIGGKKYVLRFIGV